MDDPPFLLLEDDPLLLPPLDDELLPLLPLLLWCLLLDLDDDDLDTTSPPPFLAFLDLAFLEDDDVVPAAAAWAPWDFISRRRASMLLVDTAVLDWSDDEGRPPALALALDEPAVALEAVTVAAPPLPLLCPAALLDEVRRLESLDEEDSAAVESIRRAGAGGRRPCCDPPLGARTVEGRDDVVLM